MTEIFKALIEFQKDCPKIGRDSAGQNGYKRYMYASFSSLLEATRPLMVENGLGFYHQEEDGHLKCILFHKSGETIDSGKVPFAFGDADLKEIGKNMTYARRYTFMAVLGICPEDEGDIDTVSTDPSKEDKRKPLYKKKYKSEELTDDWKLAVDAIKTGKRTVDQILETRRLTAPLIKELRSVKDD